jgi:predicted nucleic acid-binding protein
LIVVDASILATALADDDAGGDHARGRLAGERLAAPELIDLEVASVWRRASRAGRLSDRRARRALLDLVEVPLVRSTHRPLMSRIWDLRDNLSAYDASYVALAELLETLLLTADGRLAMAPGIRCEVELLSAE